MKAVLLDLRLHSLLMKGEWRSWAGWSFNLSSNVPIRISNLSRCLLRRHLSREILIVTPFSPRDRSHPPCGRMTRLGPFPRWGSPPRTAACIVNDGRLRIAALTSAAHQYNAGLSSTPCSGLRPSGPPLPTVARTRG
jgi:hypothetical protein